MTIEIVRQILEVLEKYFIYLYPGYVTLFIYYFSKAKKIHFNKSFSFMCVIISYIYILLYRFIVGREVIDFVEVDYVVILCMSIIIPTVWSRISRTWWIEKFLNRLGFYTSIEDNVWDYIQYRDKEKKGIVLKVFLDDKDLMYEGSLRYREYDPEGESNICLSGFRRYTKKDGVYIPKQNYNNDNSRWVLINIKEITRTEIKYDSDK